MRYELHDNHVADLLATVHHHHEHVHPPGARRAASRPDSADHMSGPFAHPGHWLVNLAYLAPLVFLAAVVG